MHDTHTTDPSTLYVRRFNRLMDDLEELKARAGGWLTQVPTDELEAWEARKRQLAADIRADEDEVGSALPTGPVSTTVHTAATVDVRDPGHVGSPIGEIPEPVGGESNGFDRTEQVSGESTAVDRTEVTR